MARVGVGVEVERSASPRVRRRLAPGDRLEVVARGAGEEGAQLREGRGAPEVEFHDHAPMMGNSRRQAYLPLESGPLFRLVSRWTRLPRLKAKEMCYSAAECPQGRWASF